MTPHDHRTYVPGCYRCELGRDEVSDFHCARCGTLLDGGTDEPVAARDLRARVAELVDDDQHHGWADYVATNLFDALQQVPDTGDWHGALRSWCERTMSGKLPVNRTGKSPAL